MARCSATPARRRDLGLGALLLIRAVRRPLDEPEVADVPRQRRLRHVVAARLQPRAQLFLARNLFAADELEDDRLPPCFHNHTELRIIIHTSRTICCIFMLRDGYFLNHRTRRPRRHGADSGTCCEGRHRRRERLRRSGAAAVAGRTPARPRHRGDVVVARRTCAHAARARENLGRRHRAVLGREAGRPVRRRFSGAAGRGGGGHRARPRRPRHPRHRSVRRVQAARRGRAREVVSGDEAGLAEAGLRPHRAQLRRDRGRRSSLRTRAATPPPRCSRSSRWPRPDCWQATS